MSNLRSRGLGRSLAPLMALLLSPAAQESRAQFALPGAIAPAPAGSVVAPAETGRAKPRGQGTATPVAPKLPGEDTIVGRTLYLDGSRSSIELQRQGATLEVAKLALTGDRLSRSGESCRVEVTEAPLKLLPRETGSGLRRYDVDFPACPFSFEALDGAILVTSERGACELAKADCRTDLNGLWGMGAAEFDPKRANDMHALRARVEQTVRNDFKALYDKNKDNKTLRKELVREQAGFSSRREEICRSYVEEADFGYCALRVTEARALALGTQLAQGFKKTASEAAAGGRKKR
ncbi:MAG: hypothetical protein C3F11_07445 [Methylocystaceae bacterium]|nr:MAG: hypothetical protein C3F11_07445 [Methylocystaceae bacterium]